MKPSLRSFFAALTVGLALGLGACATDSSTPAGTAAATTRAPDTYRPVGSNIPVATPAATMSDSDRQRMNDRMTSGTGPSGGRG